MKGPCYNGTTLLRNCRKMTLKWLFSYDSFVNFHGKNIWEPQYDHVISKPVIMRGVIKGMHCIWEINLYYAGCFYVQNSQILFWSIERIQVISTVKLKKFNQWLFEILANLKLIWDTRENRANLWTVLITGNKNVFLVQKLKMKRLWDVSFTYPKLVFDRKKMIMIILGG